MSLGLLTWCSLCGTALWMTGELVLVFILGPSTETFSIHSILKVRKKPQQGHNVKILKLSHNLHFCLLSNQFFIAWCI